MRSKRCRARSQTLETEIGRLQKLMADTTLYARDRAAFDQVSTAMTAAQIGTRGGGRAMA